jgi:hypothetical protein
MLKTPEQRPPVEPDRSIRELIERLLDEAVDYARAELELFKARVLERTDSYRRAALLFAVAAAVGLAGVVTLFVGIAIALARWIGPLGGAILSTFLAAGVAGLLVWLALRDMEGKT